jgi:hypothetical protein
MRRSRWIGWDVAVVAGGGTDPHRRPISLWGFGYDGIHDEGNVNPACINFPP